MDLIAKESDEQAAFVEWLRFNRVLFCHVPNGGHRHIATARRMKNLGVEAGVPDILIFDKPPKKPDFCGTAIEMKRKKGGHLSDKQKEWIEKLRHRKWLVYTANGAGEAINYCRSLGY